MWNTLKGWNMKVSEAKQKVCPFMEQRKPPIDRNCEYDIESKNINCICSDCMAWIKQDNKNVHLFTLEELNSNEECGYCQRLTNV